MPVREAFLNVFLLFFFGGEGGGGSARVQIARIYSSGR